VAVTTPAVGDMAEGVRVCTPAEDVIVGADEYTTSLGVSRFVWLSTLKNSARNCSASRSVMCAFFVAENPTQLAPGPPENPVRVAIGAVDGVAASPVGNAHSWLDEGIRVEVFTTLCG